MFDVRSYVTTKEDTSMADLAAIGVIVALAAIVLAIAYSLEKL
jgi:hypothetical protein